MAGFSAVVEITKAFEPATDGSTVHSSAKLSYIPCGAIATYVAIKGLLSVHTPFEPKIGANNFSYRAESMCSDYSPGGRIF